MGLSLSLLLLLSSLLLSLLLLLLLLLTLFFFLLLLLLLLPLLLMLLLLLLLLFLLLLLLLLLLLFLPFPSDLTLWSGSACTLVCFFLHQNIPRLWKRGWKFGRPMPFLAAVECGMLPRAGHCNSKRVATIITKVEVFDE